MFKKLFNKKLKAEKKQADQTLESGVENQVEQLEQSKEPKSLKELKKETNRKIKVKKTKDPKDKIDLKLATKEFPVKLVKEVNKIKWSTSKNLTNKYITVIIFMVITAVMFFLIDLGLQQLFVLIKVT
ncbi:preprotein translocase subunit SecE [Williamsoniiplasma luminosum]|uniref:Preprotein translocase subunit SecE n=1 Tax=Williamsoniiplasma luminosum TaxID=214888 RepID=A0A2S0NKJ4_9MOLU|nr:preprotein translocase subunit SecE [Williamsoniiplasma luminosum]AVP49527.1 MAG: preprotein translocase subunit SecE [Williamsoniiplasma luminosum]